jgi:glycosyltransferase involved in cell wall biosynthesis
MRIAVVSPKYHPYLGGVETQTKEITERLAKKGFEVEILTTDPSKKLPEKEDLNGVRVKRFKAWAPNNAYCFSSGLRRYLLKNSNDYDVVHAHQYHALPALYAAEAKDRNKLVFTPHYHGKGHTFFRNMLFKFWRFWGNRIFDRADRIVCVSNYEKGLILRDKKIDEEKMTVIPNAVSLREFQNFTKIEKGYQTILCVCRLEKFKGVQDLIRVMPRLDCSIILEIVGKGPYKKKLIRLARKVHVEERIRFYQDLSREELVHKYVNSDLFVLLSKYEAYGISVGEALASGMPCIVANTSALTEWVNDRDCYGVNYPVEIDELATLVKKLIGKKVYRMKLHDWNEIVDRLVELYENC